MIDRLLKRVLYLEENGNWYPIPAWCKWLATMGETAATASTVAGPSLATFVAVLPTLRFAATWAALGAVVGKVMGNSDESLSCMEYLASLPRGTPVVYRTSQVKKAILMGVEQREGHPVVRIRVQGGGNLEHLVPSSRACQISPIQNSVGSIRLPSQQRGRPLTGNEAFLSSLLGDSIARKMLTISERHCTIVGHSIAPEASLLLRLVGETLSGSVSDILRLRTGNLQAFRSEMCQSLDQETWPKPDVIVFNGSRAYLRSYTEAAATQIVFLDPTEPQFSDALQVLQSEYYQRVTVNVPLQFKSWPGLTSILFWRRGRRWSPQQ